MICAVSKTNPPHPSEISKEEKRKTEHNTSWWLKKWYRCVYLHPNQKLIWSPWKFWPWGFNCISQKWPCWDGGVKSRSCSTVQVPNCTLYLGYLIHNYQERENTIAQLRVAQVSFRIERQESTIKGKQVWYFALLTNQETIEWIARSWTLPWKITTPSQTSSGSQSFLCISQNAPPAPIIFIHFVVTTCTKLEALIEQI